MYCIIHLRCGQEYYWMSQRWAEWSPAMLPKSSKYRFGLTRIATLVTNMKFASGDVILNKSIVSSNTQPLLKVFKKKRKNNPYVCKRALLRMFLFRPPPQIGTLNCWIGAWDDAEIHPTKKKGFGYTRQGLWNRKVHPAEDSLRFSSRRGICV